MQEMILNPGYNSSQILRADILSDSPTSALQLEADIPTPIQIPNFMPNWTSFRRFIPRNLQRDAAAEQTCTSTNIYSETPEGLPYYLPTVRALAFRYSQDGEDGKVCLYIILLLIPRNSPQ